ncbi:MAG: hypothetical protein AAB459_04115, partial [Patescibacteria group bacterium]
MFWCFGICLLGFAAWITYRWAQQPIVARPINTNSVQSASSETIPYNTGLFATLISGDFVEKSANNKPNPPLLGQFLLRHRVSTYIEQIAITVGVLPSGGLNEVADVKLRRSQPENYTLLPGQTFAPVGSVSFATNLKNETAIFWPHDNKYAVVVVRGAADRPGLSSL